MNVAITKFETDAHLIKGIAKKQSLPVELVVKMLRYNILTANQLATMTGQNLNQIMNRLRPKAKASAELTQVGVFPEWDEDINKEKDGRLFILRNEATEKLLREFNDIE